MLLFFLSVTDFVFAGPKTDTIFFQSGDKLTCEVLLLNSNKLQVSTSDAGKLDIHWDKIDSLYIKQYMVVEMENGERIIGILIPGNKKGVDGIAGTFGIRYLNHIDIVRMYPFAKRFIRRLKGNVGTSFYFAKANKISTFEFNGNVKYNTERNEVEVKYNGNWNKQKDDETSDRHNAYVNYFRALQHKYFYLGFVSAERNSELGLNLRTNVGSGLGNSFLYTNYAIAYAGLGVQVNREFSTDSVTNNTEAIVMLSLNWFRYNSPKLNFTTTANAYPNITDFNRIRFDTQSTLKWEVLKDFFLKYTFYYTFDSKPLTVDASKQDWTITFGFEYSFR